MGGSRLPEGAESELRVKNKAEFPGEEGLLEGSERELLCVCVLVCQVQLCAEEA